MIDNKPLINTDDYMELLIKHLIHDPEVSNRAKQYKISADDFIIDEMFGSPIYRAFVDVILRTNCCPISFELLCGGLNRKFEDNELVQSQYDDAANLLNSMYASRTKDTKYICDTLGDFLKTRRTAKVVHEHKDNPDLLSANLNALAIDLKVDDLMTSTVDVHPFAAPIFKQHQDLIGTELNAIDEHINGLGFGEYGIVVGYSGGGKTVFGTNVIAGNAAMGRPAQFISCEEDEVQISQRFYSKFFEIPYTELHKGLANPQLEHMFADEALRSQRETLARNLSLIGLKGLTPLTGNQIYEIMVRKYEKSGFVPKVVVLDQLQFIEPSGARKGMQSWELEKMAAAELDDLSHRKIGGHGFALWVMHQAKGKLRKHFSREEIDGFKGIIHKADLVLGIGRDGINASEVDVFSLKVRHCADFSVTMGADFKYMRFVDKVANRNLAMESHTPTREPTNGVPPLPDALPAPPVMPNT